MKATIPIEYYEKAKELLNYDSETGLFTWKHNRHRIKAGDPAGHVTEKKYFGEFAYKNE
jgi:hypothetical protein